MEIITLMGIVAICAACYLIGREHGRRGLQRELRDEFCVPENERRVNRYV